MRNPVKRVTLELHLAEAEAAVVLGRRHIERQLEIIAELERDKHGTMPAKELLATFEDTLRLHIWDRDRLRKELDEFSSA